MADREGREQDTEHSDNGGGDEYSRAYEESRTEGVSRQTGAETSGQSTAEAPVSDDITTPEGVTALLSSSSNQAEWNANSSRVKAANGGAYPVFWDEVVNRSGLLGSVEAGWNHTDEAV